jgi:hypothetical protein
VKCFFALDFNDHAAFYHQVRPESAIEADRLVNQGYGLLALNPHPEVAELIGEAGFVGRFEQAWSERAVNVHRGSDDFGSEVEGAHFHQS